MVLFGLVMMLWSGHGDLVLVRSGYGGLVVLVVGLVDMYVFL